MTPSTDTPKGRVHHHREVLAAAKDATPEERRDLLAAVRREARNRRRSQPVPRWLAHRASRGALAALPAVPFACGVAGALLSDSVADDLVQLAGAVSLIAGLLLLRRATRELTEIPDAELDERELEDRNEALRTAYFAIVIVLGIAFLIAVADGPVLDVADWKPLIFGTLATAVLLPSAVAAWRWRDLDDEA
jgi:hypothetical protein